MNMVYMNWCNFLSKHEFDGGAGVMVISLYAVICSMLFKGLASRCIGTVMIMVYIWI